MISFLSKNEFFEQGIVGCLPHAAENCAICRDPLISTAQLTPLEAPHVHAAVEIHSCGHAFGLTCLRGK